MLKKTFIAGAAAALLGAGSLVATTASASATSYGNGYVSGNGWYFGWGRWPQYPQYRPVYPPHPQPYFLPPKRQVCTPRYKTVRYWQPYRGWVSYKVYAGQVCSWQPAYKKW